MTTIYATATDQVLAATRMPKVSCNNQNTVKLHVDFDDSWDGYAKSAVFYTSKDPTVYEVILSSDGNCVVPAEVLIEEATLYIGVRGVKTSSNEVKASMLIKYKVLAGTPSMVISDPAPNVYQQLLNENAILRSRMSSIETAGTVEGSEVVGIRTGADGTIYDNAGDSVRCQIQGVHDNAVGKIAFGTLPLTPSRLISAVSKFDYEADYITGYIFPVSVGASYDMTIEGAPNRFFVLGCYDYPKVGGACVGLTGNVVNTTKHIRLTNTGYKYFFVGVGYEIDTSGITLTVKHDIGSITKNLSSAPYAETTVTEFVEWGVGDSDTLIKLAKVRGHIFPIRHNGVYELEVNGAHNRFSIYGVKGYPTEGCSTECILSSPTSFPDRHKVTFENGDYDYAVVNIGYNIESDAPLVIREYEKNVYDLIQAATSEPIKREFYSAKPNVYCANTTAELYALYDKLTEDYPDFVSMTELGSNLREYKFTTGNYNDCTPKRNVDGIIEKPVVLMHSGTHGYERSAVMSAYHFFRDLCAGKAYLNGLRGNYTFKVIPLVCPTSFDNDSRVNANGVNIARNYSVNWTLTADDGNDYSGASPCDQNETQICEAWLRANQNAVLFIDFHNSGFTNEVSCLMGVGTYGMVDVTGLKKKFLTAIHPLIGYWQYECGCDSSLVYAYTGNFSRLATAYHFADRLGIPSLCLETSWEQNGEARHGPNTIRIGTEVLGNMFRVLLATEK